MIVLSFTTFLRGCHYDYSPQVPQNLASPLPSDPLKFIPTFIVHSAQYNLSNLKWNEWSKKRNKHTQKSTRIILSDTNQVHKSCTISRISSSVSFFKCVFFSWITRLAWTSNPSAGQITVTLHSTCVSVFLARQSLQPLGSYSRVGDNEINLGEKQKKIITA